MEPVKDCEHGVNQYESRGCYNCLLSENTTIKTANEGLMEKLAMLEKGFEDLLAWFCDDENKDKRIPKSVELASSSVPSEAVKAWRDKRDEEKDKRIEDLEANRNHWKTSAEFNTRRATGWHSEFKKLEATLAQKERELTEEIHNADGWKRQSEDNNVIHEKQNRHADGQMSELMATLADKDAKIKDWKEKARKSASLGLDMQRQAEAMNDYNKKLTATLREKEKELAGKQDEVRMLRDDGMRCAKRYEKAEEALAKRDQEAVLLRDFIRRLWGNVDPDSTIWGEVEALLSSTAHLGQRLDAMLFRAEAKGLTRACCLVPKGGARDGVKDQATVLTNKADALEAWENVSNHQTGAR